MESKRLPSFVPLSYSNKREAYSFCTSRNGDKLFSVKKINNGDGILYSSVQGHDSAIVNNKHIKSGEFVPFYHNIRLLIVKHNHCDARSGTIHHVFILYLFILSMFIKTFHTDDCSLLGPHTVQKPCSDWSVRRCVW